MNVFARIFAVVLALFAGGTAIAQNTGFGLKLGSGATQQFNDSRDKVKVTATVSQAKVAPGGDTVIAIVLDHEETWHTWSNKGNVPKGMATFDGAINTEIKLQPPANSGIEAHTGFIQWPEVHAAQADVGEGLRDYAVFSGRAVILVPLTVKADAPLGAVSLPLTVTFQACDNDECMAPVFDMPLAVSVEIVSAESLAGQTQTIDQPTFSTFDASVFSRIRAGEKPTESAATSAAPATFFGIPLPHAEGAVGVALLILLSMAGGFILNLTPCVLPIIPIKILTISQHAGSPGRSMVLGLWMAIGVVAFWAGIGIPAALFTAAADPSRLFGIWWLTLAIGAIIAIMGVGIMGLFTIQLPTAVYAVNPKADTAWGSFIFGLMTAVLGLPCFGFVAGALLAGAATMPPVTIMMIFTSIGVGMALPYLILSAKPALLDRIPRTGPASELVKQVMGLLLMAAGAYFIGSGLIALVSEQPYLGRQLHWWAVALLAVVAGLWLIVRTFQITSNAAPRLAFTVIGLAIAGAAVAYALDTTRNAMLDQIWKQYTPAAFQSERDADQIVVMDFTAEWCLTCKALKATVLHREAVYKSLQQPDVTAFTVDLTSTNAPGWQTLRDLGKTGIPLLAIYTPGSDEPWLANAYTVDQVVEAIEAARRQKMAAN